MKTLKNGTVWRDTDNNPIHAHGGHMLYSEGWYYWYGEDRGENYYVNCYRSKDLMNWEFRGHVLTTESKTEALSYGYDLTLVRDPQKDYGVRHVLCIDGDDPWRKVNIERRWRPVIHRTANLCTMAASGHLAICLVTVHYFRMMTVRHILSPPLMRTLIPMYTV